MNIAPIDATKFETLSFSQSEAAVRSPGRPAFQFWSCLTLSSFLLLHGAWLVANAMRLSPESMAREGCYLIAAVYAMMLPSFLYFAWQARGDRYNR